MRHARVRRHFKLILSALLSAAILIFLESRLESFAPQLRDYAELKVEEAFGEKYIVSIEGLDGGIFHPLALNECKIKDLKGNVVFPYLNIESIMTDYRVWDLFKKNKGMILLLTGSPHVDIKYSSKDGSLTGFARLEGTLDDAAVKGYLKFNGNERIDYIGNIKNGLSFELTLNTKNGPVKISGSVSHDGYVTADVKLSHFKLCGLDVVCDMKTKNRFSDTAGSKRGLFEGEIETSRIILNDKNFSNVEASYAISDGLVKISRLIVGNDFRASGRVGFKWPHLMDIVVMANNVNLSWLSSTISPKSPAYVTGTMNGKFNITGSSVNPRLSARFDVKHGTLAGLDFEHLNASLKGEGPILKIEDSRITRESGYFVLAGEIDLSKANSGGMFENVKLATSDTAIIWDDWGMSKVRDVKELRLKKRMSEDVGINFKKYVADEKIDESLRDTDQYELEYNLNPSDSLKFRVGQDRDFFGLEHKNKF